MLAHTETGSSTRALCHVRSSNLIVAEPNSVPHTNYNKEYFKNIMEWMHQVVQQIWTFNSFRTSNKLMNNLKTVLNPRIIGYIKILWQSGFSLSSLPSWTVFFQQITVNYCILSFHLNVTATSSFIWYFSLSEKFSYLAIKI
jgi:hypothetical protein